VRAWRGCPRRAPPGARGRGPSRPLTRCSLAASNTHTRSPPVVAGGGGTRGRMVWVRKDGAGHSPHPSPRTHTGENPSATQTDPGSSKGHRVRKGRTQGKPPVPERGRNGGGQARRVESQSGPDGTSRGPPYQGSASCVRVLEGALALHLPAPSEVLSRTVPLRGARQVPAPRTSCYLFVPTLWAAPRAGDPLQAVLGRASQLHADCAPRRGRGGARGSYLSATKCPGGFLPV
jgi:hypothetical protein